MATRNTFASHTVADLDGIGIPACVFCASDEDMVYDGTQWECGNCSTTWDADGSKGEMLCAECGEQTNKYGEDEDDADYRYCSRACLKAANS